MKEEDAAELNKRLRPGKRKIVPQDARWGLVQMHKAGEGLKKFKGST